MNRHSLSSKITFVFAISFALVCILFLLLYKFQTDRNLELMQQQQFQSMGYLLQLHKNNQKPEIETFFNSFGFKKVENLNLMASIVERGTKIFERETPLGFFLSVLYNERYYLYVFDVEKKVGILFESQEAKNTTDHLWIGFILALSVLIMTYMSIMSSFKPLRQLSLNIRKFASGDMDVEYKSEKKDEIAQVANEFDKAVRKIRHLILSRQLFLRTIMHELKTPIGKGRIVAEMIDDDVQKSRLVSIFERLDLLLNEFSKIEQLVSQSYKLKIQEYPISSIIEQAVDMLMLDVIKTEKCVKIDIENEDEIINADFEMLALALKNLLDNALKYSIDHCVQVKSIQGGLRICNYGKPLNKAINYYYGAFINDKNSQGMGLGLYIVKNILDYHHFKLIYSYQNDAHCFDIVYM